MSTPWLSVLVPVYAVAPYLHACVASILDQDTDGIEVIFVDDASPHGEGEILACWQARHPRRVRVITHHVNRGISATRNTLLGHARGDYLWFVDSDDMMAPGCIRALRRLVGAHRPDLVMCDFRLVPEHDLADVEAPGERLAQAKLRRKRNAHVSTFKGLGHFISSDRNRLLTGLFGRGYMHVWSKIVRREAWTPDLRFVENRDYEDLELMPRLALAMTSFIHVPETWIHYRQRTGSMVSSPSLARMRDWMQALASSGPYLRDPRAGLSDATRFAVSHFCTRQWRDCIRICDRLPRSTDAEPMLASFREAWALASPLGPREMTWAYLRRGQFRRCLQLHRLLRVVQSA